LVWIIDGQVLADLLAENKNIRLAEGLNFSPGQLDSPSYDVTRMKN
jgi:hypothetical protein